MAKAPTSATIRTYHVGFGDCFLLSFAYGSRSEKHVLIDFGSTGFPKGVPKSRMMDIARDIKLRTKGKLDAVVATHRHRDHISGFATQKDRKGTGDIIRSLKPDLIVQPWTEDPKLDPKATDPGKTSASRIKQIGLGARKQVSALSFMHEVAHQALSATNLPKDLRQEIQFLGESNIANPSAVKNLMNMATNSYVYCESKSGLEKVLPGVNIHVLGPPTIRQHDKIKKQRSRDPDEFWQFQAATMGGQHSSGNGAVLFPRYAQQGSSGYPINVRWMIYHARAIRGEQLLQIVRSLDQQMNNTSVILLFEAGKRKLLFPGDAQIENWEYALSKPKYRSLLSTVNLYKVGHHGSRNATPKTLWKLFKNKSQKRTASRLLSVMSTMEGKHGDVQSHTEVPRETLVHELEHQSDLFTTQQLKGKQFFHDTVVRF